ncbi:hypothetical protein A6P39_006915 [Streptomyces sp. FXJ1.172]|uniref:hypothetical protein n=1 Tax=Streptomyces sp. FXJ1.172 TaxID=710705 RepID=UPI000B17A196|nr:hypothetical protein [Streptomyces sp. FXJ1.172]WEO93763.1 hypothetical protein A6P39_006915 [Streptomyces sp. FXJ1.172]
MLDALFGPAHAPGTDPVPAAGSGPGPVPTATERDGALALAVGLGVNRAFETGQPVGVRELLPGVWQG